MKKVLILLIISVFVFSGCSFGKKKVVVVEEKIIPAENKLTKSSFSVVGGDDVVAEADRAKAVEDNWKTYEENLAGFSFKYPANVDLEGKGDYQLIVKSKKISELNDTMGFDKETALKNIEALNSGKYGEDVDWPVAGSKKIIKIGNNNAQEFMVLGRFEVCDIVFERSVYFFNNDYQIVITLKAPKEEIIKKSGKYFEVKKDSCGSDKMWNFDKQKDFFEELEKGEGAEIAQEWFDSFDGIVKTINLNKIVNNFDKIQGKWQSTKDPKTVIVFANDTRINLYDGVEIEKGEFAFYNKYPITADEKTDVSGKYLIVKEASSSFDYEIVKLSEDTLDIIYLVKGNKLSYKKIK